MSDKTIMKKRNQRLAAVLLAVLAAACSAVRLTEFQQFAAIGSSYTKAVDAALIRTGRLAIQANSMELIENRELAPVGPEALERQDQALKSFLGELALLRRQVILLNDYLYALAELSPSPATGPAICPPPTPNSSSWIARLPRLRRPPWLRSDRPRPASTTRSRRRSRTSESPFPRARPSPGSTPASTATGESGRPRPTSAWPRSSGPRPRSPTPTRRS